MKKHLNILKIKLVNGFRRLARKPFKKPKNNTALYKYDKALVFSFFDFQLFTGADY